MLPRYGKNLLWGRSGIILPIFLALDIFCAALYSPGLGRIFLHSVRSFRHMRRSSLLDFPGRNP